jgi:hypothetical protein
MYLNALIVLTIAGLSVASPAPQQLDIKYIQGAPAVQNSPPLNGIPAQAATLIASVEVFTAATASSTVAPTAAVQVHDIAKRHVIVGIENGIALATGDAVSIVANVAALAIGVVGGALNVVAQTAHDVIVTAVALPVYLLCFFTFGIACPSTAEGSPGATATASVSRVGISTVSVATTTTTGSSAYIPYYPATSTISRVITGTVSAGAACSTAIEAGTYCGFLNPEDPCAPQPGRLPRTTHLD